MFSELIKYKEKGVFFFRVSDTLSEVCNVPNNSSGIYLIFAVFNEQTDLIYIGISGRKGEDGKIKHRKDGLRGRFLTGKTDGLLRKFAWPARMIAQNIPKLEIHWYVTHGEYNNDFPRDLEIDLLTQYYKRNGSLPKWNKRI